MATFAEIWTGLRQAGGEPPFMLLDCAGLEAGAAALPRDCFAELECLFTGDLAIELADVGPWLGRVHSFDAHAAAVVEDLLRRRLAMLVVLPPGEGPPVPFARVHRHFRKFNVVYDPQGKPLFFRYYDPRVLVEALAVLEPEQLESFFGPVESLVLADADARFVRCFRQGGALSVQG